MCDFTIREVGSKHGKKVKARMNLCDAKKKRIPKSSEGKVEAISPDGKTVMVRFHGTLYKWFDKREYELFLKEV